MSENCNKYESLFVFGTEEDLQKHLEVCEDCRKQHKQMNRTANITKEVAPYYKNFGKTTPNLLALRAAAGVLILALTGLLIIQNIDVDNINRYDLSYGKSESVISDMGLPTDEYGLLMVD